MTLEEARKIARIISTADGGCDVCVSDLLERLEKAFPEFSWGMTSREWIELYSYAVDAEDGEKYPLIEVTGARA